MSLTIYIPCSESELVEAVILNSGEMVFSDYDIEFDILAHDMGDEPTICAEAYITWENDPLNFICSSGLFPIELTGSILSLWCKEAVRKAGKRLKKIKCYKEAMRNAKTCSKFWSAIKKIQYPVETEEEGAFSGYEAYPEIRGEYRGEYTEEEDIYEESDWQEVYEEESERFDPQKKFLYKPPSNQKRDILYPVIKNIHDSKFELTVAWNSYINKERYPTQRNTIEEKAVIAVKNNSSYIFDYLNQMETFGGIKEQPTKICNSVVKHALDVFFLKAFPGSKNIAGELERLPEYMDEGRDYMLMLAMKEIQRYR